MAFLRLAGCSVGCAQCDTDYSVDSRATVDEIVDGVTRVTPLGNRDKWVWITGGEPTDHDLAPLLKGLKAAGFATAVATSGKNRVIPPVDWLSVSPHFVDAGSFQQRYGSEIKLVDGLNGLDLDAFSAAWPDDVTDFMYRYVQPMWDDNLNREDPVSLARCVDFIDRHPNWAMSRQDHKLWRVP